MEYKKLSKMNYTIFAELEKISKDLQLFQYSTGAELDTVFNFKYSERLINPLCETKTSAEIAQLVKVLCSFTWDKYTSTLIGLTPDTVNTTNINRTETPTENTTTVNEVSAYNTEDFTSNDKSTIDRTGKTETTETSTNTTSNYTNAKSLFNVFTNLAFYDKIFIDVINVIALNIY